MKKTIYLVEDNFEISELIDYLLTDIKLEVKIFATAADFKKEMGNSSPDLIILDIMLPDGDGLDICREMKTNDTTHAIPVLLMSAHINIKTKAMEAAADDFISKPFDIDDFTAKVKRLVA